jgi:hypothetical protein
VASAGPGPGQVCATIKRGRDNAEATAYREEYPIVVGRRRSSALVMGWRRSSSEELRRDHGELLDLPLEENSRQDEPSPEMRKRGKQRLCGGGFTEGGGGAAPGGQDAEREPFIMAFA